MVGRSTRLHKYEVTIEIDTFWTTYDDVRKLIETTLADVSRATVCRIKKSDRGMQGT